MHKKPLYNASPARQRALRATGALMAGMLTAASLAISAPAHADDRDHGQRPIGPLAQQDRGPGGPGQGRPGGPGGPQNGGPGRPGGPGAQGPGRPGGPQDGPGHSGKPGPDKNHGHGPQYGPDAHGPGGPRWAKGDRLPPDYRNRQYIVEDWHRYNLSAPPRGYQWMGIGPDFVLSAIGTGVVLQVVLGH
ncbi:MULTISPECIES: RcnB family protein [unclassified Achromobacter]|uniref:RcnB family protein n=1 Tax=unclassified Achromobacter TaxID=2626865 RepID=UPI001E374809|nr:MULTISPECIES: RcnB family protein [unclassified Achromobacter]